MKSYLDGFAYLFLCRKKKFNITDSAVESLLKFLMLFLKVFLQEDWCEESKERFLDLFPSIIYYFRKFLSFDQNCFIKYIVCLKCNSLYHIDKCLVLHGGETRFKLCTFLKYPNDPKRHFRQKKN